MTARDIIERVVWTFVQAAIGALPVTFALTPDEAKRIGYAALVAGIAAVISLAKNLTAQQVESRGARRGTVTG